MKFANSVVALMALTIPSITSAQSTLEEKWAIGEDPAFAYSSLQFDLTYDITDFIVPGQAKWTLYNDGCKEDGVPLQGTSGLTGGLVDTANAARVETVTTPLSETAKVTVTIDPDTITSNTLVYSEDTAVGEVTAQIRFCVRFGLTTGDITDAQGQTTNVEVNFLETIVTLDVDLSDGFEIASIAVAPKDKLVRTAAQAYQVEGYICDEEEYNTNDLSAVRNQGAQIRVCVRPDEEARGDGIYMRSIDSFTWQRDTPSAISQQAVVNRGPASNTLTSLYCEPGEMVCHFVSILFASFYATPGLVSGAGVASMQFGSDSNVCIVNDISGTPYPFGIQVDCDTNAKITQFTQPAQRRNLRNLQAQDDAAAAAEFDLSFDVDQGDVSFGDSGASSFSTMAISMVAAAGAVMML